MDESLDKLEPVQVGVAGEYFVAAELSRRGFIASVSLRNTRGIDILATNKSASRSVTIQCKANQTGKKDWPLNQKDEGCIADNHFFVFVLLGSQTERPTYYVVPGATVARYIAASHQRYLAKEGRNGPHQDGPLRRFKIDGVEISEDDFRDRWDLLGL